MPPDVFWACLCLLLTGGIGFLLHLEDPGYQEQSFGRYILRATSTVLLSVGICVALWYGYWYAFYVLHLP